MYIARITWSMSHIPSLSVKQKNLSHKNTLTQIFWSLPRTVLGLACRLTSSSLCRISASDFNQFGIDPHSKKKINLQFILAAITHIQLTAVLLLPAAIWSYAFVIRGSRFHIPSCHQFIVPSMVAIAKTSETIHSQPVCF